MVDGDDNGNDSLTINKRLAIRLANRLANQVYRAEHAQEIAVRRKLYYWENLDLMRAKNREYKRRSRAVAKAKAIGAP